MRGWIAVPVAVVAALGAPLAVAWQEAPGADAHRASAALFAKHCAGCHVVADPARESDRAWLAQVAETS